MIESFQSGDGEEIIRLRFPEESIDHWRSVRLVEEITLGVISSWFGKLGFSSPGVTQIRGAENCPSFGQFSWDIVGPSYLATVVVASATGVKNGFLVGDISLGQNMTLRSIKPFLAKWDSLRWQKRATRFQPMLVAKYFEPPALAELRKRGCIVALPKTLFGEEAAEALFRLISTIEHAAVAVIKDPNGVFELVGRLAKLEGAAGNLRGVVLELLIAHLYHLKGYNIDVRKVIYDNKRQSVEVDVRARNVIDFVFCECKAKSPGSLVGHLEIEDWLDRQVPRMKSWAKTQPDMPDRIRFEFYSSSGFTEEATALIEKVTRTHKKQPITFIDGFKIVDELHRYRQSKLVDIFKEQFGALNNQRTE